VAKKNPCNPRNPRLKNSFSLPQIAVKIVIMNIKGRTVIITGSTGKLASQIILAIAEAGANCVCIYHKNSSAAKKLQTSLKKMKVKSLFIQTDLTHQKNIEKVFADIGKFAKPQILINAAAVFDKKPIENITFGCIRQTFDINFAASMIMTQKFVDFVRRGRKIKSTKKPVAKIINIADITAQNPPAGFSVYCASKAALIAATKSLAKELAPEFTVNAVSPGIINWQKGTSAKLKKKILASILAGRTGSPQEVIQAVKFLIENDYITGQVINIDGGKAI
jgi:NAD(P)-dependent dehydrogenase (short-subunit alcohol dehydrogenase family)